MYAGQSAVLRSEDVDVCGLVKSNLNANANVKNCRIKNHIRFDSVRQRHIPSFISTIANKMAEGKR